MIFLDVNHSMIVIWKITMLAQLGAKQLFVKFLLQFLEFIIDSKSYICLLWKFEYELDWANCHAIMSQT